MYFALPESMMMQWRRWMGVDRRRVRGGAHVRGNSWGRGGEAPSQILRSHLFARRALPAGDFEEWEVVMEAPSQASSAAEKKKRVETVVATKASSNRGDISEKAVASSTTSNGEKWHLLAVGLSLFSSDPVLPCFSPSINSLVLWQRSTCTLN